MHQYSLKVIATAWVAAILVCSVGGMQLSAAAKEEPIAATVSTDASEVTPTVSRAYRSQVEAAQAEAARQAAEAAAAAEAARQQAEAEEAARQQAAAEEAAKKKAAEEEAARKKSRSVAQKAVDAARSCIGIPYGASRYGTTFDCSGLTQYAYKQAGISLAHSAEAQYNQCTKISRSELQAGDLVFWSSGGSIDHVGIYTGNGKVIDASPSGVVERAIYTTSSQTIAGYGRPY